MQQRVNASLQQQCAPTQKPDDRKNGPLLHFYIFLHFYISALH
jgi:hypothetical protein